MEGIPRNVEKQGDKANELQKQIIEGNTEKELLPEGDKSKEVAPVTAPEDEKKVKAEDEGKKEKVPEKAAEPSKEVKTDEGDFKQKYLVLQGKYDKENARRNEHISSLTQSLEDANRTIANLNSIVSAQQGKLKIEEGGNVGGEAKPDPQAKLKVEDFEGYGQEMSELVNLANQQAMEIRQLREKVGSVETKVGAVESNVSQSAEERFYIQLRGLVKDWQTVNKDPAWIDWLEQADPLTGQNRQKLLDIAQSSLDANLVANFFKTFKEGKGEVPKIESSETLPTETEEVGTELGDQIIPDQAGASSGPDLQPKVKIITAAQFAKAVKDTQTGRMTEADFNKISNQYQRQMTATT